MLAKRDLTAPLHRNTGQLLDRTAPKDRQAWFRVATTDVDRDGRFILPGGIDLTYHKTNPVFLWQHQSGTNEIGEAPEPDVVIGRVVQYDQTADNLDVLVEFDDDGPDGLASRCWEKVRKGLINMVSLAVGLGPAEKRTVGGKSVTVYPTSELWEISLVIIGSNRAALRLSAARTSREQKGSGMEKSALCKALGIDEQSASRGTLIAAHKSLREAIDEHFPEEGKDDKDGEDKGAKKEGGEEDKKGEEKSAKKEGGEGEKDDPAALKEALKETQKALREARAKLAGQGDAEQKAAKRETKLRDDVEQWAKDGRIKEDEKATWLDKHRDDKAWSVVKHIERGTHTSSQRLRDGGVGAPVADLPEPQKSEGDKALERVNQMLLQQRISAL